MKNNQAFTLIELLVVVLIIGILAAVALPQYDLAVKKSKFSTYRTLVSSMVTAARVYHLANGNWPQSLDELSIELPADMTQQRTFSNGACLYNNKTFCCLTWPTTDTMGAVSCGDNTDYSLIYEYFFAYTSGAPAEIAACIGKTTASEVKTCKALGGQQHNPNAYTSTPIGTKTVHYYELPNNGQL